MPKLDESACMAVVNKRCESREPPVGRRRLESSFHKQLSQLATPLRILQRALLMNALGCEPAKARCERRRLGVEARRS